MELSNLQKELNAAKLNARLRELQAQEEERERACLEDKKNQNFYQLDQDNGVEMMYRLAHGFKLPNKPAVEMLLFQFLAENMDGYNALMCSQKVLMEELSVGRTTIHNAIKNLEKNGVLHILKSGTSNVYVLNPDLIWKAANDKRKFCEFHGKILISRHENPQLSSQQKPTQSFKLRKVVN